MNESYKKNSYGVGEFLFEITKIFFLALIIIIPIRMFLFQQFFVHGMSMEPNLKNGEYIVVKELGYKKTKLELIGLNFFTVHPFLQLERGDIAIFRPPHNYSDQYFIKRVIGLPGEKIKIKQEKIFIFNKENPQGVVLDEELYISKEIKTENEITMEIPEDSYFVMGDNRSKSSDSRSFGPINKDMIIGKVILRLWPLNKISIF